MSIIFSPKSVGVDNIGLSTTLNTAEVNSIATGNLPTYTLEMSVRSYFTAASSVYLNVFGNLAMLTCMLVPSTVGVLGTIYYVNIDAIEPRFYPRYVLNNTCSSNITNNFWCIRIRSGYIDVLCDPLFETNTSIYGSFSWIVNTWTL